MSVVHRFTGEDNNFNWEGAIPRVTQNQTTRALTAKY